MGGVFALARNDLEEQITTQLAKEMSEEIDRQFIWNCLAEGGWTKVVLPTLGSREQSVDIKLWIEECCKDEVLQSGREFLFKNSKDATIFILRWYQ